MPDLFFLEALGNALRDKPSLRAVAIDLTWNGLGVGIGCLTAPRVRQVFEHNQTGKTLGALLVALCDVEELTLKLCCNALGDDTLVGLSVATENTHFAWRRFRFDFNCNPFTQLLPFFTLFVRCTQLETLSFNAETQEMDRAIDDVLVVHPWWPTSVRDLTIDLGFCGNWGDTQMVAFTRGLARHTHLRSLNLRTGTHRVGVYRPCVQLVTDGKVDDLGALSVVPLHSLNVEMTGACGAHASSGTAVKPPVRLACENAVPDAACLGDHSQDHSV